jgi:hypothetical protein
VHQAVYNNIANGHTPNWNGTSLHLWRSSTIFLLLSPLVLLFAPLLRKPKRAREPFKPIEAGVYGFLPLLLGLPTLPTAAVGRHQQKCERNEPKKLQRRKDRLNGAPEERRYFLG